MVEIEVFGGGIFGLSVAYACQKRGAKVRLIEKAKLGSGSSNGIVGALAPHTPDNWNDKKQFQYESLIAAAAFWQEIDELSGLKSGYCRDGRLVALKDERELSLAYDRVSSAKEFWYGKAEWHVIESGRFPNWEPESATGYLAFDTLSAHMSPQGAGASLAAAFQKIGGIVLEGKTIGKGADATVLCTGYQGLLDLSQEFGCEVGKGVKGQGLSLDFNAAGKPHVFADGVHIIPHADGTVGVGSTTEIEWDNPEQTDEKLEEYYSKALRICPALEGAGILRKWAGVRPRGRRRSPILGRHPLHEGVFVANGGFKIGFGMAVRIGEVMADLVINGHAEIPESFSVEANLN